MQMDNISHISILIVDDDMSDLDILNEILKSTYTIYFAKSGRSALKRAKENKPDIILLDVVMPDMNGFEVLSELKKSAITCNIPVIFITWRKDIEYEKKGFDLGAVDYITKPFHSSIVKARIKSHLKVHFKTEKIIQMKDDASLALKVKQNICNVLFRDIMYVDVSGHWINFHLVCGENITIYATLKEYKEILLVDSRFAHCHQSFIVNMNFVEIVETRDVLMKNGACLPISKRYGEFRRRYFNWVNTKQPERELLI